MNLFILLNILNYKPNTSKTINKIYHQHLLILIIPNNLININFQILWERMKKKKLV